MTDLLTRLLALAELAVDEALQFDYGDPEDRYIWRELQELKLLVAAALAQPEPEGVTDDELDLVFHEHCWTEDDLMDHDDFVKAARAVLARWGRPAIEPVPVNERLPGPEDCDANGFCWFWDLEWSRWQPGQQDQSCTHWLPAHALPVPQP